MRGYGGYSSYGGGFGGSRGYGSSYGGSSSSSNSRYGGRSSTNRYSSSSYAAPTQTSGNKYTQSTTQQPKYYSSQKLNQKSNNYGNRSTTNAGQYKQTQPKQNYPQSQYIQGYGNNTNNKNNNGRGQSYPYSTSKYRYKNQTVKNKTVNQNINVNQQQQHGRFGRFGGGFGRMMKWPLMFMMFDRFRRPRHEPMPMQQQQPQQPPIINVYNPPPPPQAHAPDATQQTDHRGDVIDNKTGEVNRQDGDWYPTENPLSRKINLTQDSSNDANNSGSQFVEDDHDIEPSTRVQITRAKSEPKPNRLRELSHTPTIEPVSSNASSGGGGNNNNNNNNNNISDLHELRGYHTNEIPNLQTRSRPSNKDLSRGLSNQTIGLQSILRQSPPQEL
ncbi:hypothetical protein CANMA_002482 [Candida margitis]|uniref:uncharacterized protein n=1 Tax=Candida margitis TaxID=1775924 RepID=UPI0022272B14|nr:uncharacterized protein CANMA_002482 [Candida margitis]KAI5968266.1 hypothetical protein CANMA_002482 [Candida margitis]